MEFGLVTCCYCYHPALLQVGLIYGSLLCFAIFFAVISYFARSDVNGISEAAQYVLWDLQRSFGGKIEWRSYSADYWRDPELNISLDCTLLTFRIHGNFPTEKKLQPQVRKNALYRSIRNSGFYIRCSPNQLVFRKTLKLGEVLPSNFVNWIDLTTKFTEGCQNLIDLHAHSLVSESHCAFCKEKLGSVSVHCLSCQTPHHRECFQLNHGCSVFGCSSAHCEREGFKFFGRLRAS